MSNQKLIVIDTADAVLELIEYIQDKDFIAIDCETTGLSKSDSVIGFSLCAEEGLAYYIILERWDAAKQEMIMADAELREYASVLLHQLAQKQLIAHNAVYDCMMIESNFKISLIDSIHTDTMILAHLLDENNEIGLKALGVRLFGEDSNTEQKEMEASVKANGGLLTKDSYELYKGDAHLIGKYGAKDTILTYKLFTHLVPQLYDQGLDQFFYEDESMPLLRGPTYELNTTGLQVDIQALTTLKKTLEAECLEAESFINQEIAPHIKEKYPATTKKNVFNMNSNQQLAWLLFGVLGLEFGTLTDGGKEACEALNMRLPYHAAAKRNFIAQCLKDLGKVIQPEAIVNGKKVRAKLIKEPWAYIAVDAETLEELAPKHKWIERLLEYKKKQKILNTYVEGIEERTKYGIIQPSFKQAGTTSGRYSSSNPNWQNLPRNDKRIKACITARSGRVFVGADQSQLEPRIFAYYSKDKALMSAFDGTTDFYSVIGMKTFDKTDCTPQKEGSLEAFGVKYKALRDLAKVIPLAVTYGSTAHQLSGTIGKSLETTQQIIDDLFEEFPGIPAMMKEAHDLVKKQGFVTNYFGRPRRMPEAMKIDKIYGNGKLPYEARTLLNLACNHRIQSTAASIMNRSMIALHKLLKESNIEAKQVTQVHDSIIVECLEEDAETVSILLQYAMETTVTLEGIKLEAKPLIGKNFSEV